MAREDVVRGGRVEENSRASEVTYLLEVSRFQNLLSSTHFLTPTRFGLYHWVREGKEPWGTLRVSGARVSALPTLRDSPILQR